jgi:chromosome segregation ATPase
MRKEILMISRATVGPFSLSLVALVLATGCASSKQTQGEKAYESFQGTRAQLADAQLKVDNTLTALGQFQYTGNLNNAFQNYKKAVADLEECSKDAQWRAQAMRENEKRFVENWQKEMEKIQDENVKASMEARREAVRQNFTHVRAAAAEARQAYEPFMRGNKDLVQSLSTNLSPAAVPSLKPAMEQTRANGQVLKAKIAALQKQLNNIAQGLPATGGVVTAS